ncbi:MAG TPA: GNAT family N-acetyltransferase [Acidobacteriota bacterium]|jgi:RimJ/RimL family protein N-acetyltransferase
MKPPERFESERLILRLPRRRDAEAIFRTYAKDPRVTRYLTWKPHSDISETREYLERCLSGWRNGPSFTWTITHRRRYQLMGMFEIRIGSHDVSFGYVLARRYWNQGYMTELVETISSWALAQPEIYRVCAYCDTQNEASWRVLEKAGLQREGVLRRWIVLPNLDNEPRDCYCYARVK